MTFTSIAITGANPGDFTQTVTTCGPTLAAKASCTVSIQFAPLATGARSASLTVTDDARAAAANFRDQPPEGTGTRAAVRLAPIFNVDMRSRKCFSCLGKVNAYSSGRKAFNLLNPPNFTNPSLNLQAPLTFGEFQGTLPPRSMQFALRYEF